MKNIINKIALLGIVGSLVLNGCKKEAYINGELIKYDKSSCLSLQVLKEDSIFVYHTEFLHWVYALSIYASPKDDFHNGKLLVTYTRPNNPEKIAEAQSRFENYLDKINLIEENKK